MLRYIRVGPGALEGAPSPARKLDRRCLSVMAPSRQGDAPTRTRLSVRLAFPAAGRQAEFAGTVVIAALHFEFRTRTAISRLCERHVWASRLCEPRVHQGT